jgi:acyl-CoA hydrolase
MGAKVGTGADPYTYTIIVIRTIFVVLTVVGMLLVAAPVQANNGIIAVEVADQQGESVEGATVDVYNTNDGVLIDTKESRSTGVAVFNRLAVGSDGNAIDYKVSVYHPQAAAKTERIVSLSGNTQAAEITIPIEIENQFGQISGHIVNSNDKNLQDAEVELIDVNTGETIQRTTSDSDGRYMFERVEFGTAYKIKATYEGKSGESTEKTVDSASNSQDVVITGIEQAEPAEFAIDITPEDYTVTKGNPLKIAAKIENTGGASATQPVRIDAGFDDTTRQVTLAGGESTTKIVQFSTKDISPDTYTIQASSDANTASNQVTIKRAARTDANFAVQSLGTNEPVPTGSRLEVTADIANTGDKSATQSVRIDAGFEDRTRQITLAGGKRTTTTVEFDTDNVSPDRYTIEVATRDDMASTGATIERAARSDANLAVESLRTTGPVTKGGTLEVTAAIANTGDQSATQPVRIDTGFEEKTRRVSVAGGERTTLSVAFSTKDISPAAYTVQADTGDDTAATEATIERAAPADANFAVEALRTNGPVQSGDSLAVTTEITNTGDQSVTQTIQIDAGFRQQTEQIFLTAGERTTTTVEFSTTDITPDTYAIQAETEDDTASSEVTVERPPQAEANFAVQSIRTNEPAADGESFAVTAEVTNTGDQSATQPVRVDTGFGKKTHQVTLAGGESTTTTFEFATDDISPGSYTVQAATEDDSASRITAIQEPANSSINYVVIGGAGLVVLLGGLALSSYRGTTTGGSATASKVSSEEASSVSENDVEPTPDIDITYDDIEKHEPIGSGGNADVYKATVSGEGIDIAVKQPRMSGTIHNETIDRILDEAQKWQKLDDHDNIVDVIDYGSEPIPWIAMELMNKGHLGEVAGQADIETQLETAIATTNAVHHAHRHGVAHLDLKPENVLIKSTTDHSGIPKVGDWGLSKQLLKQSQSVEAISPHYAAPEQFEEDRGKSDHNTDIYQLGAVFYELFTGQPPYEGRAVTVMNDVLEGDLTPPSDVADIPAELDEIIMRAMATNKNDRYSDIVYLKDDLQELYESIQDIT